MKQQLKCVSEPVKWLSPLKDECQGCESPFDGLMYDMKTIQGPWGNFCKTCAYFGPGIGELGLGKGQEYTKQPNGDWLKTGG